MIYCQDILEWAKSYEGEPSHALLADAPYFLSFMGEEWDTIAHGQSIDESKFKAWFAGLVAGEAFFSIVKMKKGANYTCRFGIHMRADEAPLLRALARKTGAGSVHPFRESKNKQGVKSKPSVVWMVQSQEDCQKIAALLNDVPLFGKKQREYDIWVRALQAWMSAKKGNRWHKRPEDNLEKLYQEMKQVRPFDFELSESSFDPSGPPIYQFHYKWAMAVKRHLLPGAFLMVFSSSRTYHRLACAIEDAGYIMHSSIGWVNGSGYPKASRVKTGEETDTGETESLTDIRSGSMHAARDTGKIYTRAIKESHGTQKLFEGHRYGRQALKPAMEFICVAQKPYEGKPIDSIVRTGAGTLNIDAARIGTNGEEVSQRGAGGLLSHVRDGKPYSPDRYDRNDAVIAGQGRWPANFLLTHSYDCKPVGTKTITGNGHFPAVRGTGGISTSGHVGQVGPEVSLDEEVVEDWECAEDCPVLALDQQSGEVGAAAPVSGNEPSNVAGMHGIYNHMERSGESNFFDDEGTASRFFHRSDWELEKADPFYYAAKASTDERDAGLFGLFQCLSAGRPEIVHESDILRSRRHYRLDEKGDPIRHTHGKRAGEIAYSQCRRNGHPTVKPISLNQYLASLLLPPKEYTPRRILVPFAGVASEMAGAALAGWEEIVGVEKDSEHVLVGEKRFAYWSSRFQGRLF